MTKLETTINTVMQQLQLELASETWESRRRYFNQMIRLANKLNITEPCQEIYDSFIADDNGSPERRSLHIRCVKLVDALADTQAKDEHGILFNEPAMPDEATVQKFFENRKFPVSNDVCIDYLIVKAATEIKHLGLTDSTIGQYMHSWMDIRRYFHAVSLSKFDESLLQDYLLKINAQRNDSTIKEWKWKINRKAAYVLKEVACTGCFHWDIIHDRIVHDSYTIEMKYINKDHDKSMREVYGIHKTDLK